MEDKRIQKITHGDDPEGPIPADPSRDVTPIDAEPVRLTVTTGCTLNVPNEIPLYELNIGKEVSLNFNPASVTCLVTPCETIVPIYLPGGGSLNAHVTINQIRLSGRIPYSIAFAVSIPARGTQCNPRSDIDFVLSATGTAYVNNVVYYTESGTPDCYPNVCNITGSAAISNIIPVSDGSHVVIVEVTFTLPAYD